MNRNVATAIVSLVFAGPALAAQQTVVPAFFAINRKIDGNTPDWTRIANQRGAVLAVVALGGPNGIETCGYNGQGTCDAAAYHTQFGNNSGAGQKVLGYVDAGFACTQSSHLNDKLSDSQTGQYGVATWYSVYPTELQGIFFDRGPQFSTCSCSNCGPYDL